MNLWKYFRITNCLSVVVLIALQLIQYQYVSDNLNVIKRLIPGYLSPLHLYQATQSPGIRLNSIDYSYQVACLLMMLVSFIS